MSDDPGAPPFELEAITAECLAIAAIPAPPGEEASRAAHVHRRVSAIEGWQAEIDTVGNVVASRAGRDIAPTAWILTHLDTVFTAETPLIFERTATELHGPGCGDNAIAIAAALAVMQALPAECAPVFAFTVGEESTGNLRGARHLLDEGGAASATAVLAIEGHRGEELGTGMVGSIRYRLSAERDGGHSWWDRGRPSAIHDLMACCRDILNLTADGLALNVGTIHGGTGVTAIAARAEAEVEARAITEAPLEAFDAHVRTTLDAQPRPIDAKLIGRRPAGTLAGDHPLVAAAQAARQRARLGLAPLGTSSSDANPFIAAGISALIIGISTGQNAHQVDERISLGGVLPGTRALRELVRAVARRV